MNKELFDKLVSKAGELAMSNKWGEKSFKINRLILEMDSNNSAACTRLAKYFRLNNNLTEAKNMYSKALEINPNNLGALNNLIEIESYQQDKEFVANLATSKEAYDAARSLAQKGRFGLSMECFMRAYSIEPILKSAFALAKIYRKSDKREEVKKIYNQLVKSSPSQNDIDVINAEFGY